MDKSLKIIKIIQKKATSLIKLKKTHLNEKDCINKVKYKMKEKKKKYIKNANEGFTVNEIFKTLNIILESLEQIFINFYPLVDKILLMEGAKLYFKNGTVRDLKQLLDNISRAYKKLLFNFQNFSKVLMA